MSSNNPSKPITHLLNGPGAERQLVEGLLRGEEGCYRQLYEVFAPRLRALLQRIFRDPALVDDAVQATFLAVFQKIEQFGGRSSLFTWMTRIGLNKAGHLARKQARTRRLAEAIESGDVPATPEQQGSDREHHRQLEALIAALPLEKRSALLLFEVEGFSVQEIADVTGEPRGTVLARLSRTRAELREAVQAWQRAGGAAAESDAEVKVRGGRLHVAK